MKDIIIRLVINIVALLVVVNILSGVIIPSWGVLLAVAIVIAILNAFIKPFLLVLTIPINIFTLGIFTLFINAFLFWFTSVLVKGFYVQNFWAAFWGALIFSIVSIFLNMFIGKDKSK